MEASRTLTSQVRKMIPSDPQRKGFALIATISILVLLALISVGLLSLSTVTVRTTSQNTAQMEARANARMGLMIALGELQKQLGPDKRVNATAGIFDSNENTETLEGLSQNYLTGVWDSRSEELGIVPDYDRETGFRKWLVSNEDEDALEDIEFAQNGSFDEDITLLTAGNGIQIKAGKVGTDTGDGSYAWWVGDENSKARINPRNDLDRRGGLSAAEVVSSFATPGPHGVIAVDGFENFETNTVDTDKLVSMDTLALMDTPKVPKDHVLDLTPHSQSLLTNVKDGGLREDLSLYFERDDINWETAWGRAERARGFPQGPLGPNGKIALSPPDEYDVLSWKSLYHWFNMSRQVTPRGFFVQAMNGAANVDKVRNPGWNSGVMAYRPVITRLQILLSYSAEEKTVQSRGQTKTFYDIAVHRYPVLTIWNPYNVSMRLNPYHLWLHTLPITNEAFRDNAGNEGEGMFTFEWGRDQANAGNSTYQIGSTITLDPGQARVLSYAGRGSSGPDSHLLTPGEPSWEPTIAGAGLRQIIGNTGQETSPVTEQTRIVLSTRDATVEESGISYNLFDTTFGFRGEARTKHNGHGGSFRDQMFAAQVAWRRENSNPQATDIPASRMPNKTIRELTQAPVPFLMLDIRLKALDETLLPNKTWAHCIPSLPFAAATSTQKHSSDGVDSSTTFFAHPYTADFRAIVNANAEGIFNSTARFGSSYTSSGQEYITSVEIPLAPITSLAQLQNLPQVPIDALNWSGYYLQNHAIGNSFANPGVPSDEVKRVSFPFYLGQYFHWQGGDIAGKTFQGTDNYNGEGYTPSGGPPLIVDRSYAANHLLWDNYFFSSLASQQGSYVHQKYGSDRRSVTELIDDLFLDEGPIPNGTLKPILGSSGGYEDAKSDLIAVGGGVQTDAYEKVGKYLAIEGGFNVNSTSVPAWKAVLGSTLKKNVAIISATSPGSVQVEDEEDYKYIVSRFTIPNGRGFEGNGGNDLWRGYRELTGQEIDELANAIVEQVKLRGPFRSLGEFVNRQLGEASDPKSLYGALQAALEDDDVSINQRLRSRITQTDIAGTNYAFKEAALGSRYQGAPAYIAQADLLNTLGPLINARSDTFTIRAYGEALAADGVTIEASAWCEAVVQRFPEYVDSTDDPDVPFERLVSSANKEFGRRFRIKSFRWLNKNEV